MIRILIADDHQIVLDGLIALVDKVAGLEVVSSAKNGLEILEKLKDIPVDVVVLDINMPKLNGVETCKKISIKYPEIKVIAISMHKKRSFINRMIKYGAMGYILKDDPSDQIISCIKSVSRGKRYFSPRIKDFVLGIPLGVKVNAELSKREVEVLRLISSGLTNQEMANKLFLSPHTVESHRRNLFDKLGARNSADLVRRGIEKGFI